MLNKLSGIATALTINHKTDGPGRISARARLSRALSDFHKEERGSLVVFGLMMLVLMIMVAGISVDLMHFETRRAQIQTTLDDAVLAAANLDQTIDPTTVVKDYFTKAGLSQYLSTVSAQKTMTSSTVTANADVYIPTNFMHMMGIDKLQSNSLSTAQETIGNVEIALVLDNSGSMASNSKIQNLRIAAKQFIDTMFQSVAPGKLSISIISYSSQVNIGPTMMAQFNTTSPQTTASCINFANSDYTSTAISTTTQLQRTSQFDPWDKYSNTLGAKIDGSSESDHECPLDTIAARRSVFFSTNQTALDNFVTGMQAMDNTSIDLGVKWGAAALDPSMQQVVTNLISKGYTTASAAGRPVAYGDHDTAKVLVVMTDGENTARSEIKSPYITGNSTVWYNSSDASYSLYDATKLQYWSSAKKAWLALPYGNNPASGCTTKKGKVTCTVAADPGYPNGAVNWTWQNVWNVFPVYDFMNGFISPAYGYNSTSTTGNSDTTNSYTKSQMNTWYYNIMSQLPEPQMDTNLHNICSATKSKGVTIYSIGFLTNSHGASVLTDCATSPAYYFNVTSSPNISAAFAAIASNINLLRLTQ